MQSLIIEHAPYGTLTISATNANAPYDLKTKFYSGDIVVLSVSCYDDNGELADPEGLTLKVKRPDGSFDEYLYSSDDAFIRDGTGRYHLDYPIDYIAVSTSRNTHQYGFSSVGNPTKSEKGYFDVEVFV